MGKFLTDIDFDEILKGDKTLAVLKADLIYKVKDDDIVTVPSGYITDGSSIPSMAWGVYGIGNPLEKPNIMAGAIHDYICQTEQQNRDLKIPHKYTWQQAHQIYFQALLDTGKPYWPAKIMQSVLIGKWLMSASCRW